jgi:hypothetical protein
MTKRVSIIKFNIDGEWLLYTSNTGNEEIPYNDKDNIEYSRECGILQLSLNTNPMMVKGSQGKGSRDYHSCDYMPLAPTFSLHF